MLSGVLPSAGVGVCPPEAQTHRFPALSHPRQVPVSLQRLSCLCPILSPLPSARDHGNGIFLGLLHCFPGQCMFSQGCRIFSWGCFVF